MAKLIYPIRPTEHALDLDSPLLSVNPGYATWPSQNLEIARRSNSKRSGYVEHRNIGAGINVNDIAYFQKSDGVTSTLYLVAANLIKEESSGTWSYKTQKYSAGAITGIASAVVTGDASVDWTTGTAPLPAAGDYFIMDADLTAASEPDVHWHEIASVDLDTQITLVDNYSGATSSGDYTIRQVYTVPSNERMHWAVVHDNFYFTNGNIDVQVYTGTGNATTLDATNASKARYLIEYADRLIQADVYSGATRKPHTVEYSKSGDPSDWTAAGSGSFDLEDTEGYINGVGKVGANLVIFKTDSFAIAHRTVVSTAPIAPRIRRPGIGCSAPYGVIQAGSTCAWIGYEDFYMMNGDQAKPIGKSIRSKFFDLVNPTELKRVTGYYNSIKNQLRWFATDDSGNRRCFVYNWKNEEWMHFMYHHSMSCGGKGEA